MSYPNPTPKLAKRSRSATSPKSRVSGYDYLRTVLMNWSSRLIAAIREFRWLQPLHRLYGPIKFQYVLPAYQAITRSSTANIGTGSNSQYQQWTGWCEQVRYNREKAIHNLEGFAYKPRISVVMPVYNTREEILRETIDSVRAQYYSDWELCICDDGSTATHIKLVLNEYSALDQRIKVFFSPQNKGIANASNRAIGLATGEFVGLLDHDDKLTPDALYEVVTVLQEGGFDLIYSDEDRIDAKGERSEPAFKPAWSPDLLLSCMYLNHFCVYRKRIIDAIGGFREGLDGSQDYDLALRFTEKTSRIAHIPKVLYHWRKTRNSASSASAAWHKINEAGKLALSAALHRRGIEAEVESERYLGLYRIRRKVPISRRVSILITPGASVRSLSRCIRSIELKTNHKNFEIMVLDHANRDDARKKYLEGLQYRVIRFDPAVSRSRMINTAAREARGEHLLLLNGATEVINADWLTAMLEQSSRPEIGAVGAKLLYRDGRIEHAGIVLGVAGIAGHAHRYVNGFTGAGYLNYPNVIRNYSAVTGACLMTRRDGFERVAGFDEEQSSKDFCDVDFCLRLQQRDLRIVYTPYARLYHHVPTVQRLEVHSDEATHFLSAWRRQSIDDLYYNPNLSRCSEDFSTDFSKPEALCCIYSHDAIDKKDASLEEGTFIGQEFVTREDLLHAIEVDLEPLNHNEGVVRLHLRDLSETGNDIALVEVTAATVAGKGRFLFTFDPIRNSAGKTFYFYVEKTNGQPADSVSALSKGLPAVSATHASLKSRRAMLTSISFRVYSLKHFR